MPFDTLTTAAVTHDLQTVITGGQIQRIIQPSTSAVALGIYRNGALHWLLLSVDPSRARVQLAKQRLAKAFATPSPFVMLLRKHLEGRHVREVRQEPGERIITVWCAESGIRLATEIMGKHSNVILIDDAGVILGAIKTIGPRQSRVRPILPGGAYAPPPIPVRDSSLYPAGDRIDPCDDPYAFRELVGSIDGNTQVRAALQGLLVGVSPFLSGQIAQSAGYAGETPISQCNGEALLKAALAFYGLYRTRAWSPCTFEITSGRRDFAPYVPVGVNDVHPMNTISDSIEECSGSSETHDVLSPLRSALIHDLEQAAKATDRKISSLLQGFEATDQAERVMEMGQLVLAYQYAVEPGATRLEIADMDLSIPLDPSLSAKRNADRLFRRYHKLRDARRRLPALLREAQTRKLELQDLISFAHLATTESELIALRRELPVRQEPGKAPPAKAQRRWGPARFALNGYRALVGRSARENEEVTFRLAGRDDLWLHARERTGAHVVLHGTGQEPPDEVVEAAARLAAYFSEARSDTKADVDSTRVKHVRKISGGPPGRVTYSQARTFRVEPSVAGWIREGS